MSNIYYSIDFKYEVVMAYKGGGYSLSKICLKYQIQKNTVYRWNEKFELFGMEGLADTKIRKQYSKELKEAAVRDYLSGNILKMKFFESMR